MSENAAAAYIAALKTKLGLDSDDKLARAIGIGKSTLASWRKRGEIPKKSRDQLFFDFGLDYDLVVKNSDGAFKTNETQIRTAFYLSLIRLGAALPDNRHVEFASWLASYDYRVRYLILDHFERDEIVRANPNEFIELLMRVARGEHGTPEQIVALKAKTDSETVADTILRFPT